MCKHKNVEIDPPEPDVGLFGFHVECRACGDTAVSAEQDGDWGEILAVTWEDGKVTTYP